MLNKSGIWILLVNEEEYGRYYSEQDAIFNFESYLENEEYSSEQKIELVRVLRTTKINEEIVKHRDLDTCGDWRLYPSIEGVFKEE